MLVDPDDDLLPRLHPRATLGMGLDELGLHIAALDGSYRPAHRCYPVHFRARIGDELIHESFDDVRASEDVVVLQQVGFVGEDLLDAQRPLLVPGPGQAQRLIPCRQLDRASTCVARQCDGEHLQDDALDVVLRLRLRESK